MIKNIIKTFIVLIFSLKILIAQSTASWADYTNVVHKFYELVDQKNPPTVQDFLNIFDTVYMYEQILVKEYYMTLGFTELQSLEKSEVVLEKPESYESLLFKKIREYKDEIFPDNYTSYKQKIFIALDTCDFEVPSEASIEVLVKKNDQTKTIKFRFCSFEHCGPLGPTIEDIIFKDGSSFLKTIFIIK